MSGPGYRYRYPKNIEQGSEGHYPSHNKTLTLRHGGKGQEAGVPWVAGRICSGAGAGQPYPFTGSEASQVEGLRGPVQGRRECGTVIRNSGIGSFRHFLKVTNNGCFPNVSV